MVRHSSCKYTKADHDRFPIDPVKLEKLAEVAIKVGLQLQKIRIW